jgi:aryl-alcohol dehydrogenase-like predicted oxidoreductase
MTASDFGHGPSTIKVGDFVVPRLGFGAMQIPGPMVWGEPKDPERARAVLRRVVELGIGLIDTAWYYGPHVSHRFIMETLHPYPKELLIVTKLGGKRIDGGGWAAFLRPEELRKGCEEDLRGLRKERIDLVHLRLIPQGNVPFKESLDAILELQKEGKIRHVGLSNVTLAQLEEGVARTTITSVQNMYNVAAGEKALGDLPHARVAEQDPIVDYCTKHGIVYFPFFSLNVPGAKRESTAMATIAKAKNVSEAQLALAWQLARSPVMLPIPGTSSPAHLEENWAARTIRLTADEIGAIAAARAS